VAVPVSESSPQCDAGALAVSLRTLGCKVNRADSERIAAELMGCGVRLTDEAEARAIVINTCTVTGEADRKARKAVRHALELPQRPVVVVTGCLASLDAERLEALGDRVVVEADRDAVHERVAALLGASPGGAAAVRAGEAFRTRVAVKVEDGCDAFCAYCIVPYARGVPRSVPVEEVTADVSRLVASGTVEVVLTGINIGKYRSGAVGLPGLVESVAATGVRRIRLSSIEPLDLTGELLGVLSKTSQVCPHLHVPLQSGSDAVLAAMGRGYTAAEYVERLDAARAALPGVSITTDVMVGFPGESEADFEATRTLVSQGGLSRLHVFRYSKREGTRAAAMDHQVPPDISARRAATLRAEDARLRRKWARARLGQEADVLVERLVADSDGVAAIGTTGDYLTARLDGAGLSCGDLVRVRVGRELAGVVVAERL
jgi:threonylcarbamoyladenosine tRNA methylthiotransferase MtaB